MPVVDLLIGGLHFPRLILATWKKALLKKKIFLQPGSFLLGNLNFIHFVITLISVRLGSVTTVHVIVAPFVYVTVPVLKTTTTKERNGFGLPSHKKYRIYYILGNSNLI